MSVPVRPHQFGRLLQVTPLRASSGAIFDVEGDLMTAPDSLAHCVSACLGMGKGIAVHFKSQFGNVDALKAQNIGVGGVAILPRAQENRFIYYLITKPRYNNKPTYDTLRASLKQMVQHMRVNHVPSISIPELGCGLDGLEWGKVFDMLKEEFNATGINVTVFHFRGAGQTAPPTLPRNDTVAAAEKTSDLPNAQQMPSLPNSAAASNGKTSATVSKNSNSNQTSDTATTTNQQQQANQPETKAVAGQKKSFADLLCEKKN